MAVGIDSTIDSIAFVHNFVLSHLLYSNTKSAGADIRSDEHILYASSLACDAAKELGITVELEDVYNSAKNTNSQFYEIYDNDGELTALSYINRLPLPSSIIEELGNCFINDVTNGDNSFEQYLANLAQQDTKAAYSPEFSFTSLYDFLESDSVIWNRYLLTKGGTDKDDEKESKRRHVIAVATDVVVGVALGGLGPVGSGVAGALASEVMEKAKPKNDPENTTD